jgi:hypothetical protein
MNDNNDVANSINWNDLLKHDARAIDGASIGQVQGLFEPLVVIEKGTLNKEMYYIPKSVIEKYDQNTLYCLRDSPPSEEDARKIQVTAERLASTPRNFIVRSENQEEEILRNLKAAAGELKDILLSGTRWAKEKIEENQAQKDAQKISKMGEMATSFTTSFDEVMSEIKTSHTYEEQVQIYNGFIKLLEQQRELVVARRDLASKLKTSDTESSSDRRLEDTQLRSGTETEVDRQKKEKIETGVTGGGFVLPSNEAPTQTSLSGSTTNKVTKKKVDNTSYTFLSYHLLRSDVEDNS